MHDLLRSSFNSWHRAPTWLFVSIELALKRQHGGAAAAEHLPEGGCPAGQAGSSLVAGFGSSASCHLPGRHRDAGLLHSPRWAPPQRLCRKATITHSLPRWNRKLAVCA